MAEHKLIQVDIKNKKHLACCGTIESLLTYLEKTQQNMKDLQKEMQGKNKTIDQKINEMNQKYNDLKEKAVICGCTKT